MTLVQSVGDLCARLEHGDTSFPTFLASTIRLMSDHVTCSRAAMWVFEKSGHGRRLRCLAMYDRVRGKLVRAPDEIGGEVTGYFRSLKLTGQVVAEDIHNNPVTAALFSRRAVQVKSLLGVPLSVNGETFGTLVCTQLLGERQWTRAELAELRSAGAKLSLSVSNFTRQSTLTQPAPLSTF